MRATTSFEKLMFLASFGFALFSSSCLAQDGSFSELFEQASQCFSSGEYERSAELLSNLKSCYSEEDVFVQPSFNRSFLSIYGMSCLMVGDYERADELLLEYCENYYSGDRRDELVLIGLIFVKRSLGADDEVIPLYETFFNDFPNFESIGLLRYEKLVLHLKRGDVSRALAELNEIDELKGCSDIKNSSRLVAIDHLLTLNKNELASDLLLASEWQVDEMPELALLAKCAMQIAQFHVTEGDASKALNTYRFVPYYASLVKKQEEKLSLLEMQLHEKKTNMNAASGFVWSVYYEQLMQRMRAGMDALVLMEDYTPQYLMEYGGCFLRLGKFPEAWVIFRTLAYDSRLNRSVREKAHYCLIMCCYSAEQLDESRELCFEFNDKYPSSLLLPHSMFLLSRAYHDLGELEEANKVLSELIHHFEDHDQVPLWRLNRGANFYTLAQNDEAVDDFEWIENNASADALVIKARYWKSMVLKDSGSIDEAIEIVEGLRDEFPHHWMFPDFQYRQASYYYSKRDYLSSETLLNEFLRDYSDHPLIPEAKVLLGDTLMALGRMVQATSVFDSIEPFQRRFWEYAFFQIGKIYKALEKMDEMEHHFERYIRSYSEMEGTRLAEALSYYGWVLENTGRSDEAADIYCSSLAQHGNEKEFNEVHSLLFALKRLHKTSKVKPMEGGGFESWFSSELKRAKEEQLFTYWGRLQLYEATQIRRKGDMGLATAAILNVGTSIPRIHFDDMMLGEVGLAYCEADFATGIELLKTLIEKYPRSIHRGASYYGLALVAMKGGHWERALRWVHFFEKESSGHSKYIAVQLLKASCLTEIQAYEEAVEVYNEVLRLKQGRGEPHIKCLVGLAKLYERVGDLARAIPYWQRVYTLYRGYRSFAAVSYFESGRLFEELGMKEEALRSYKEMLSQSDLNEFPEFEKAKDRLEGLLVILDCPEGELG